MRLYEAELKLMELFWEQGEQPAKSVAKRAAEVIGWNKNTTYTILKKLVDKQAIERREPNFVCVPLISREEVQRGETESLIKRLYGGSKKALFAALLEDEQLEKSELEELKSLLK